MPNFINKLCGYCLAILLIVTFTACTHEKADIIETTTTELPENAFYYSGFDSASELKQFVDELKIDVASNNKQGVAAKISYPISIRISKERVLSVKTRTDFIEHYDEIINQKVKDAVAHQNFNDIKENSYGVMLGRGVVWIGSIKLHEQDDFETKIIGINNQ
ncbi:hypothetical protein [uncultured Shewanella sp.]|uniref:hypothetical protein n=1 Tax=uncultured Shewanella sp. TaxID=173975 RepID=UPI00261D0C08|nr:hypothetical protein [uncultured Shewanella sp.]